MGSKCEWDVANGQDMVAWTLWGVSRTCRTLRTGRTEFDESTKEILQIMAKRHGNRQAAEILEASCR